MKIVEGEYAGDKEEDTSNAQLEDHNNMSAILPTRFSYHFFLKVITYIYCDRRFGD